MVAPPLDGRKLPMYQKHSRKASHRQTPICMTAIWAHRRTPMGNSFVLYFSSNTHATWSSSTRATGAKAKVATIRQPLILLWGMALGQLHCLPWRTAVSREQLQMNVMHKHAMSLHVVYTEGRSRLDSTTPPPPTTIPALPIHRPNLRSIPPPISRPPVPLANPPLHPPPTGILPPPLPPWPTPLLLTLPPPIRPPLLNRVLHNLQNHRTWLGHRLLRVGPCGASVSQRK